MVVLTNRELYELHVTKAVGVRFETDMLDQNLETYEIVSISESGARIEKRPKPVAAP